MKVGIVIRNFEIIIREIVLFLYIKLYATENDVNNIRQLRFVCLFFFMYKR